MVPPDVPAGARKVHQQGSTFYVVGDDRQRMRDAYHTFLKLGWWWTFGIIAAVFLTMNLGFACAYLVAGGVEGADGSFLHALSFSVETMATIGYGEMHPVSTLAITLMITQSVIGLIFTALTTGLVFAKFSRPTTRVAFSRYAVITTHEGKPTLVVRLGNRRSNVIVEAKIHVVMIHTTKTKEGDTFYKATDLKLVRDRQVGMTRGWNVMHVIDEHSPLHGRLDQASLARDEVELHLALTGTDDITVQTVHAMHHYDDTDIKVGYRFADLLKPLPGGEYIVDLSVFDQVVPDTTPRDSVRA